MKTGLSLYDTIRSYAGYEGKLLTEAAYHQLTQQVATAALAAGVQRVIARVRSGEALEPIPDATFLVTSDQPRNLLPRFAKVVPIAPTDWLVNERFFLVADTQLPFVMVGRATGTGQYQTMVSNALSVIEGVQTILNGYERIFIPIINTYAPEAFRRSGALLARTAAQFGSEIVASWLQDLLSSPPDERLSVIQQMLNATYVRWGNRSIGEKPPSIAGNRYDGVHQHQKLLDEAGQPFEAIGMINDSRFLMKCQTIVGALPVLGGYREIAAQRDDPTPTHVGDVLAGFSLDAFMQEVNLNGLDLLMKRSDTPPATAADAPPPLPATTDPVANFVQGLSLQALQHVSYQVNVLRDDILNSGILQTLAHNMREPMQRFINQSADLLFLIDEIAYVHQVAERIHERKQPIEVDELINAIVITFAGEAERQGVQLLFDMPDTLPPIEAEPEALNRAVMVLLENALERIAGAGWIRIEIEDQPGALVIRVLDNGSPLGSIQPEALFEPQFSSDGNTTLGFVLVNTIMMAHQGQLRVAREGVTNIATLEFSR